MGGAIARNRGAMEEDELALRDLLLDIQCLDALSPWTSGFNLFDVLKISRTEIRHSNMLAWLLDPNESHGMGGHVLQGAVQYVTAHSEVRDTEVLQTLLMDVNSFTVRREWRNIDILVISDREKFVLCIENKVGSQEHGDQLKRYREIIKKEYPKYRAVFVFLTPDGEDPSDMEHWRTMSYRDMLEIVIRAKEKMVLRPDVDLLLTHYIETVRRAIVGDERLVQICKEIYARHRRALDLIYENRPNAADRLFDMLKGWCEDKAKTGLISFDPADSVKIHIRFTTPAMTRMLPECPDTGSGTGWKGPGAYFYEIENKGDKIQVKLTVCNIDRSVEQRDACERLMGRLKVKGTGTNWLYKELKHWNWCQVGEDDTEDMVRMYMDGYLEQIREFENSLLT